jgi:hypothetical protein
MIGTLPEDVTAEIIEAGIRKVESPSGELLAERERLVKRIAEIDEILAVES